MKITQRFRPPRQWLLWLLAVLAVAEGSVRALGLVDFALYQANAQIGYIPAASQQGSFLNKNDWQFNALQMGAPAFAPNPARDVLLAGDSLVYGGNAYRQPERLGQRVGDDGRQHFAPGQALLQAAGATRLVDMQQDPRWGVGWYKDGIHPSAVGNQVLAASIADALAPPNRPAPVGAVPPPRMQ